MAEHKTPRVFISYAWSSTAHRERVRQWAERLVGDHVEVVLDVWDLREGHNTSHFMERVVVDPEISHVLMFCDKTYVEKADARQAGVGAETTLISKEVYASTTQSKFIPIFCELDDAGRPVLPAYLSSTLGIDFSTDEKVNENWEQLVRLVHGKPRFVKPPLGPRPSYLDETTSVPDPARGKFHALKRALETNQGNVGQSRDAFLDSCMEYADALRIRDRPKDSDAGVRIVADAGKLIAVRDHLVDWVLLESGPSGAADFEDGLVQTLERLAEVKSRPQEVTNWNRTWFQAHQFFAYETFLYIIAALLRRKAFGTVRRVLTTHYLRPESERHGDTNFNTYHDFYFASDDFQAALSPPTGSTWRSAAGVLMQRQAQRSDIKYATLIEADYIIFFKSIVDGENGWFPQLMHTKDRYGTFPLFVKAERHRDFMALATITGMSSADEIRKTAQEVLKGRMWGTFWPDDLLRPMNLPKLDTLP